MLTYAHVEIDESGTPVVAGTRTKVVEVALDHLAHGWDADEIRRQHPHLTLGQIHASLAYYFDHQAEMDRDIERRLERVDEIGARLGDSALRARLRTSRGSP